MKDIAVQQGSRQLLPQLADVFTGFPSWGEWRALFNDRLLKLEDEIKDGRYVVRAEVPGIDPAKDLDVTVRDRRLTIRAERCSENKSAGRSEFSYGSFVRVVPLPEDVDENDIKASYDKGILTVSVALPKPTHAEKHIPVEAAN